MKGFSGLPLLLFSACVMKVCLGLRILAFFPMPSHSHQSIITKLVNRMSERGHDVTYYSVLEYRNLHPSVKYVQINSSIALDSYDDSNDALYTGNNYISFTIRFWKMQAFASEEILKTKAVQNLINSNDSYDVVIHESLVGNEYAAAFVHKFRSVGIFLSCLDDISWLGEMSGLTDNPSYVVDCRGELTDEMTFFERVQNWVQLVTTTGLNYYLLRDMQKITDQYMNYSGWESRPSLAKLIADNALVLLNSHHSIGYSYPLPPNVKEIGGINVELTKPLPKDLKKFMDEAPDGVVYVSFGTIVVPDHRYVRKAQNHFISAFAALKQRVVWKFKNEVIEQVSKNVYISKWFPQNDVLAHKNVKLFITHGGLQSMIESIHHQVPMIVIPFFSDQPKNAKFIVKSGLGLSLDILTLENASLVQAINNVIDNPRYKSEAQRRSILLKDRQMTPLSEAVYWIEYVARHGSILQPAAVHLSFMAFHHLDIYLFLILILYGGVWTARKLGRSLKNRIFTRI